MPPTFIMMNGAVRITSLLGRNVIVVESYCLETRAILLERPRLLMD
jgi:hypothetical protein